MRAASCSSAGCLQAQAAARLSVTARCLRQRVPFLCTALEREVTLSAPACSRQLLAQPGSRPAVPVVRGRPGRGAAQRRLAAPAAAVSAPVAAAACAFVDASFVAASAYAVLLFSGMLLPPVAWRRRAVASLWTYAPLGALYLALLVLSWEPDTLSLMLPGSWEEGLRTGAPQFFPQLRCIMELLQRRITAASAWAHLLAINAFLGRYIYLDGWRSGVLTQHSLLLALFAGPLGLASHSFTKWAAARLQQDGEGKGNS